MGAPVACGCGTSFEGPLCPACGTPAPPPVPDDATKIRARPAPAGQAQPIPTVAPARCSSCGVEVEAAAGEAEPRCANCRTEVPAPGDEKRREVKRRLEEIRSEVLEQTAQPRFVPPNAGIARTRGATPTMMRTRKDAPDATQPMTKAREVAPASPPPPPAPAAAPVALPAPAERLHPRAGRILAAAGLCAAAALAAVAICFGGVPESLVRLSGFGVVLLAAGAALLLVAEAGRK